MSTTTTENILEFRNVSKFYGAVIGLNSVSVALPRGIIGLVGPNGAGKSTFLKLAAGQLKPSLGEVTILGQQAWEWKAKTKIGFCPEVDSFYEDMTGRDFVRSMARLVGYPKELAYEKADAALERVGMASRADRIVRGYSKGMRQRTKLAQALLHSPELLILDEPLSGIDPVGRQEMLDLFRSLAAEGKCLLISSHELEELEKLTEQVIILAKGRIADQGSIFEIRERIENLPLSIRIDSSERKRLAQTLLQCDEIATLDLPANLPQSLIVRVNTPKKFYESLAQFVLRENLPISRLEPLDESAHAILGYLLGGSGKT